MNPWQHWLQSIFSSPEPTAARGLEMLEPRVLLSTSMDSDASSGFALSDAAQALAVHPIWFEDLVPQSNGSGGYSAQHASGQPAAIEDDTLRHEWLIQLTEDAALAAGSVAGVGQLLGLADIGVTVIRGLGTQGLVLVNDSVIAPGVSLLEYLDGSEHVSFLASNVEFAVNSIPNDPLFGTLWGLHNTGQSGGRIDADIDAPEAWAMLKPSTGPEIVVAVIDTGVDYTHPDLIANMWVNPGEIPGNGIDDDGNGFIDDVFGYDFANNDANPMDDHGHGTHVAGTIAATHDNSIGVAGVAPDALIMALKFMSANGNGSTANAIRAINYATMMNTDFGVNVLVTNNSWGGGGFSRALYDAIAAGGEAGIIFIASAGNDGQNIESSTSYPASYKLDSIISVASTTRTDAMSDFSNFGLQSVDIAAPGSNIRSTLPGGKYGYMSGTSMAAPHVAGAAALYLSQYPHATVADVKQALLEGADSLNSLRFKVADNARLNLVGMLNIKPTGSGGSQTPSDPNLPDDEDVDPTPAPEPVLAADLSLNLLSTTWGERVISGDKGKAVVELYNEGDLLANGKVQLAFYLSTDDQLDSTDTLVLLKSNVSVKIQAGQSRKLTYTLKIPPELLRGEYHILAMLMPATSIGDSNSQNNLAVGLSTHELVWMLGDLDGRRVKTLTVADAQGRLMKFSYTGPGTITLDGDTGVQSMLLTGSTDTSKLTITSVAKSQPASLAQMIVKGSIRSITASSVMLSDQLVVEGSIRTFKLGQVDTSTIELGSGQSTTITLGHVTESRLIADGAIKSLTLSSWLDEQGAIDFIEAGSLSKLTVKGDFQADLIVADNTSTMTAKISGSIFESSWEIGGAIKSISASQSIEVFTLIASGAAQSISAGKQGQLSADLKAQSFGTIKAGGLLTGQVLATGLGQGSTIKLINAGRIEDFSASAAGHITTIRAGDVTDAEFESLTHILSFTAKAVRDTELDAQGTLRTVKMSSVSDVSVKAGNAGTIRISGAAEDFDVLLRDIPQIGDLKTFQLKSLSITGQANDLSVTTQGNIDKLTFGSLVDSQIHVGLAGDEPDDLEDVVFNETGLIRSLTVKGLKGQAALPSFSESTVLARQMGSVSLRIIDADESLSDHGIATQAIDKYSRREGSSTFKLSKQNLPGQVDSLGRYALTIVA